MTRRFFATAPRGMTGLLVNELRALGITELRPSSAGVSFEADLKTAYRVCLWSRVANRVLMQLKHFKAASPEELYAGVQTINWDEHLDPEGTLAVDCTLVNSKITHSHYAALKVKDAVVDQLRERFDTRPSVDLDFPDIRINLHLRSDQARISLDLSGGSLHRRGYRLQGGAAPLKENLAAAILLLADWPLLAGKGAALIDPLCGSGTLLIEAALMAGDVAPGLLRDYFGFLGWRGHEPALWQELIEEAEARREAGHTKRVPMVGYDHHPTAIQAATENIRRAGVEDWVSIRQADLMETDIEAVADHGLLVANPPYGERLGELNQLGALYSRLGQLLSTSLRGWHAAIFTGNPELAAYTQLNMQAEAELNNGPIECSLYRYAPSEAQLAMADASLSLSKGAEMFANRVRKNLKHLRRWADREGIDCYRVYDADLPEYALAVDLYRGDKTWIHVQEYQAPKKVDPQKAQRRLQEALSAIPQLFEVPVQQVFIKVRKRQKGKAQYKRQAMLGAFHEVREYNARLWVNFSDYLDTGLFLDHRITRYRLQQEAKGKDFLNLFAYTGSATVHAALGGANKTITVDMSRTYLDWAERNFQLNGMQWPQHQLIQANCMAWLKDQVQAAERQYDLIFMDPPTFSNSKRMEGDFDVQRDHVEMIRDALVLLKADGVLYFSNNFRRFKMDYEALQDLKVEDISRATLPRDFERNSKIHQCWRITR